MCNRICGCFLDTCHDESCEVFTLNNGRCHTCHRQFNTSCQDKMSTLSTGYCENNSSNDNNRCCDSTCEEKSSCTQTSSCDDSAMKMSRKIIKCKKDEDAAVAVMSRERKERKEKMLTQLHVASYDQLEMHSCHRECHQCTSSVCTLYSTVINSSCDQVNSRDNSSSSSNNIKKQSSQFYFHLFKPLQMSINYQMTVILISLITSLFTCASASPSGKLLSLCGVFFVDTCSRSWQETIACHWRSEYAQLKRNEKTTSLLTLKAGCLWCSWVQRARGERATYRFVKGNK